jgi:RNA polymerase sigma factor (sigma-70 family)
VTTGTDRFDRLYAQHSPVALQVAYLLTGDLATAEDLTQEAFVKLLSRYGHLRKPESFRSYLLRTVVNLAKNGYRSKARGTPETVAQFRVDPVVAIAQRDELVRALSQLPLRQQTAVVLRYCVDLSEQQTADAMGTSVKAVKSLVGRGLTRLRELGEVTR